MPHDPEELPLAHRLICARAAKGLSKLELSAKIGVSRAAISSWERGDALPSENYKAPLCEALDLDMKWLADELPKHQMHDPLRDVLESLPARPHLRAVK